MYRSGSKGAKAQSFVIKMQPFDNFYINEAHTAMDIFCFAVFFKQRIKMRVPNKDFGLMQLWFNFILVYFEYDAKKNFRGIDFYLLGHIF